MNKPSARNAEKILSDLLDITNHESLAYLVAPNTILTLSGTRAYCDGVFYHDDEKNLKIWAKEIDRVIESLKSITEVSFAQSVLSKTPSNQNFVGYDLILTQGLEFAIRQTRLIDYKDRELINQDNNQENLIESIVQVIKKDTKFNDLDSESLYHIVFGILLGYPDEAIVSSVKSWNENDPFAEPLIEADIRGARYYSCPQPIYQYPRHLVTNKLINEHESWWSSILKEYYSSDFHKKLELNKNFQDKISQLGMSR